MLKNYNPRRTTGSALIENGVVVTGGCLAFLVWAVAVLAMPTLLITIIYLLWKNFG